MRLKTSQRSGFALIILLVILGILSLLIGTLGMQVVRQRTEYLRLEQRLQTKWLVRAGIDLGVAKLQADPSAYQGEKAELMPKGRVVIRIEREGDIIAITSEATFPTDDEEHAVVRTQTRRFHRMETDGHIFLQP